MQLASQGMFPKVPCRLTPSVSGVPTSSLGAQNAVLEKQEKQFAQLVDDAVKRAIGKSKVWTTCKRVQRVLQKAAPPPNF